jgi:ABC-type branched-subunit amino acid transport system permease subunit
VRDRFSALLANRPPTQRRAIVIAAGVVVVAILWAISSAIWPGSAPLGVVLQGAVFGTVTGLLAIGLVLIYRTNKIINFAYASMGGVGGVLSVMMFQEGHVNYFLCMATGAVAALLLGGLTEVLVIRRFQNATRLILTVATIGLAQSLGVFQTYIQKWFGSTGLVGGFETPFTFKFSIDPVVFTGDHMVIICAVPPIIIALAWFMLKTNVGIAVRAAADNADRALLYGIPIRQLSTIVWTVAGGIAGLTFILKAPFAGSTATVLSPETLLLPALAAAVVARMESLPVAFFAGVGLEILSQLTFWNTHRDSVSSVSFLLVILVALILQRARTARALEQGSTWSMAAVLRPTPSELKDLPEVKITRYVGIAVALFVAIYVPLHLDPGTVNLLAVAGVWGIVAVSLVELTGWGGHISLGQFAIVGVGAITYGNIALRHNIDMFVVLLIAGVAGGVIALLVGLPALRITGMFLAVTTLAFAVALDSFFLNPTNFPDYVPGSVLRPVLFGRFDLESEWVMYYLTLAFLVLTILAALGIRKARSGRALLATRDNYRAAAAAAVPTTTAKLSGFVLSGVVAGIAGGLYILILRGARAGTFQPGLSTEVFSWAVIGGLGSIFGALIGVFTARTLSQVLSGELRLAVGGVAMLWVLSAFPGGLGQVIYGLRDRVLRVVAERRGILVPSLVADKREQAAMLEGALTEDTPEPAKAGRR